MKVPLHAIAHGRAGDKGDASNISVIAYRAEAWPLIEREVTAERIQRLFDRYGATEVRRYQLPQLHALNFVIENALGGGVNASLALDRHGKTLSSLVLAEIEVEITAEMLPAGSPYL
ncbi:MAG: hypothetical protein AAF401_18960 [Pseudomonadota bacterium]